MIIKRNWRDVHPTIACQIGIDRRLLSAVNKAREDIQGSALDLQYRCLKSIGIDPYVTEIIFNAAKKAVKPNGSSQKNHYHYNNTNCLS
jgi:hypothetical protein